MKIAYFDCFSGISGDMTLGALVDAGLDPSALIDSLKSLDLDGFDIQFKKETRGYLSGTRAEVRVKETKNHRHLPQIREIIEGSPLNDRVKIKACAIFSRLAEAEAAVHGISPDKVHFHEVGALDAIVDIVGSVCGLDLLGVEGAYCSEISLGKGVVKCQHGLIPIPAPAVINLLKGFKTRFTEIQRELTTPTGAAIVTTCAQPALPSFVVNSVGYGFGFKESRELPNALRLVIGSAPDHALEEVILLETNLDDVTGEMVGYLLERCLEKGALDAYAIPMHMKKSRPGILFCAITNREKMDGILTLIHQESGVLGVRMRPVSRSILQRESFTAQTPLGPVRVKKALIPGSDPILSPEHDDLVKIAREKSLPMLRVLEQVNQALEALK